MSCSNAGTCCNYFLPDEVVIHNDTSSAWVIVHRTVIDVTPLLRAALEKPPMKQTLQRLLALAGQDLSVFFYSDMYPIESENRQGEWVPIFPPGMERNPATGRRWCNDPALVVGRITRCPCPVKIINTLTFQATEMVVCCEDTVAQIRHKFLRYNDNAAGYEWRKDIAFGHEKGKLRMDQTLAENGFRIEPHFGPVSVIWLFYILPPDDDEEIGEATLGSGKCSPAPAEAVVVQSAAQESACPDEMATNNKP